METITILNVADIISLLYRSYKFLKFILHTVHARSNARATFLVEKICSTENKGNKKK
jgi:hypothetical protein